MNDQPTPAIPREDAWAKKLAEKRVEIEGLQERMKALEFSLQNANVRETRSRDRLKAIENERDLEVQRHSREKAKFLERMKADETLASEFKANYEALLAEVARDAKTIEAMAAHANLESPRPDGCRCLVCQLRAAIEDREMQLTELRKKIRGLKEELGSFRGPPSKR